MVIYAIVLLTFILVVLIFMQLERWLTLWDRRVSQRAQLVLGTPTGREALLAEKPAPKSSAWSGRLRMNPRLENSRQMARIQEKLSRAGVPLRAGEYMGIILVLLVLLFFLGFFLFDSFFLALGLGVLGMFLPPAWVQQQQRQRIAKIEGQLLDATVMMASALRAGHSLMQALELVSRESPAPLATEFARVIRENRLGVTLEESLQGLLARVESAELELMISGILIQRQVGGNMAEILDHIADALEKRVRMRGQIRTLTAQGRMTLWVLALLPIAIMLFIYGRNPEMRQLMVTDPLGRIMMVIGVIMFISGIYAVRKVVDIDV